MKRILFITILSIAFGLTATAQVTIEQKTADACARCFNESEAKDSLLSALKAENAALKNELRATERLIEAEKLINKLQAEQIEILARLKCSKLSFFFGLISKKSCY